MSLMAAPINGHNEGVHEGGQEDRPEVNEKKKAMVRIVIADDHPIVRDGLKKLLLLEEDFDVVGEAGDGREVLEKVQALDPDVLLLDLRMPNLDGLSALQALQQTNKRTRVIMLTASEDKNEFVQAMKLGCSGIVLKQTAPDLIVKSIRKVNSGEIWLDSHTTAAVMRQFSTGLEGGVGPAAGGARAGSAARFRRASARSLHWSPKAIRTKRWPRRCSLASRRSRITCTTSSISWAYRTGWNWHYTPSTKGCICRPMPPTAANSRKSRQDAEIAKADLQLSPLEQYRGEVRIF